MSSKTGVNYYSGSVAWLSAINRGPSALSAFLQTRGPDHHGPDGLGLLSWIQNQHRHDTSTRMKMLKVALGYGLDPDGPPSARVSPLLTACQALDGRAIRLLLSAGANPDHGGAGPASVLPLEPIVLHAINGSGPAPDAIPDRAGRLACSLLSAGANPNLSPRCGGHLLDSVFNWIEECQPQRTAALGRFLDLFWDAGAHWQSRWTNQISSASKLKTWPDRANARRTEAERARLDQDTSRVRFPGRQGLRL